MKDYFNNFNFILNNIKRLYFNKLNNDQRFWTYAEYGFLICLLHESSEFKDNNSVLNYSSSIKLYIDNIIQHRLQSDLEEIQIKLQGKILAFDVHSTMFDSLGESETGGFIDGCDTPPPEFWIYFDGENLYSFIPAEFIEIVNSAIEVSMGESLVWYTDLIEI